MNMENSTESEIRMLEAVRILLAEALGCPESDLSRGEVGRFLEIQEVDVLVQKIKGDLFLQWKSYLSTNSPISTLVPQPVRWPKVEELPPEPSSKLGQVTSDSLEPQIHVESTNLPNDLTAIASPTQDPLNSLKKVVGKPLVLPNAWAGKAYDQKIILLQQSGDAPIPECTRAKELGLEFVLLEEEGKTLLRLFGIPTQSGDLTFDLLLRDSKQEVSHQIKWTVNPDPRSLWKDIPSNPTSIFWKPDFDSLSVLTGKRKLIAASQRGRSHGHEGTCRDDDFQIKFLEDTGWYLIAVADGAGSAKYSRRGAQLASQVAIQHMEKTITKEREKILLDILPACALADISTNREIFTGLVWETVGQAAFTSFKALEQESLMVEGSVLKDFATTLLLGAVKEYPGYGWFAMTYWVGDGGIGVFSSGNGTVKVMGTPDEGEFAGQTRFLTMSDLWSSSEELAKRLRLQIFPEFTSMVWMTDGITDPIFQTDNNLNDPEIWRSFQAQLDIEAGLGVDSIDPDKKLLAWLDFWSQGNHDDRTLAILY